MQKYSIAEYSTNVQNHLIDYLLKSRSENISSNAIWQNAQLHLEAQYFNENHNFGFNKLRSFFFNCLIYKIYDKSFSFLTQEQIYFLCYPYLKRIHNVSIIFNNELEYHTIDEETLKEHLLIIKYVVEKTFDQDVWNLFEKFNNFSLRNEINISINNPQYELDNATKKSILSHCMKNKRKRKRVPAQNKSLDKLPLWLGKSNKDNNSAPPIEGLKVDENSNINKTFQSVFAETFISESQIQRIEKEIDSSQFKKPKAINKAKTLEQKQIKKPVKEDQTVLNEKTIPVTPVETTINSEISQLDEPSNKEISIENTTVANDIQKDNADSDSSFELPNFISECWNWREDSDIILI